MRRIFSFFSWRHIGVQIAALVVLPPLAIHLVLTTFFFLYRPGEPSDFGRPDHDLATLVQLLAASPAPDRPALIAGIGRAFPQLGITQLSDDALPPPGRDRPVRSDAFPPHLGPRVRAFPIEGADDSHIGIRLPDGTAITAVDVWRPHGRPGMLLGGPWAVALLSVAVSIVLLGLWAARMLIAPLSAFARSAEDFSLDGTAAPLPEKGPYEIRIVARALNRMHERITALMRDRTQMLAAISHDLRTPITRLRLRSEFIEDEAQRSQMLRDLDQMRAMLASVLSLLRNDHALESMTLIDLPAMLQLICDQFCDLGRDVTFQGAAPVAVLARPDDLHRAVTNLVENAVRFGAHVQLRLGVSDAGVIIDVEDDGPGIDDARKAAMLEPFVRGDDSRNLDEAPGFGLGLSIARSVALAHGGTLSLHDRQPHGLIARITLPVRRGRQSAA